MIFILLIMRLNLQLYKISKRIIFVLLLFTSSTNVFSATCPSEFGFYSRGVLNIDDGVTINGNAVPTNNGGNEDGINPSDGTLANQNPQFTLPDLNPSSFPSNSSTTDSSASTIAAGNYDEITVSDNTTTTFTGGTYNIDKLEVGEDATIILAPGTYYINELEMDEGSTLTISPAGSVQIFIGDGVEIEEDANINAGGSSSNLTFNLYNNADFEADSDVSFTGVIYSPFNSTDIEFGEDSNITGGLITNGKIDLEEDVTLTYNASEIAAVNAVVPCSSSIDHFLITHDGTALTCEPETITVTACADASCSSSYTSTDVSVTLTPTGWVSTDTQTISSATGSGDFQLSKITAGTYTLGVSSSSPSATNAVQCDSGGGGTSCDITFYDSGFIYDVPNLTSCATSASVTVSAVRLDDTSQACIPTFQNETRTVNFWSGYSSPATGSNQVVINNGSTDTTIATSSPGTGISLDFNGSGQATMTVTYSDAGQLSLSSSYTSGTLTMTGSNSFVTTPAKLYVYTDDANSACASNDANCTAFTSAGSNFNLKARAACADNTVTPNFILSNIALTHTNTAPAVAQGTISTSTFNITDADNGENASITQSVSEVGVFTFTATAPTYLGTTGPSGTSTYIGRFTPGHFCVSSTSLTNRTDSNSKAACTDNFSYLSEDFTNSFTLTAQRTGATCGDSTFTSNYTSTFSKFDTSNLLSGDDTSDATETGVLNFASLDSASSTDLSSRINFNTASSTSSGEFTNGSLSVTAKMDIARSGSGPAYTAETAFTSTDIGIKPIDTDNVTLSTTNLTISGTTYYNVGNTALYFGRLYADDTFGSENEGLPMWAEPQYCNAQSSGVCTDWQTKTDDTCSLYTVSAPADTVVGEDSGGINGYWVSGSDYSANSGISYTTDSNGHKAGWKIWYTAGGTGGTYSIPFITHPYLVTKDGSASFGLYRGDDRIIYWREIFN